MIGIFKGNTSMVNMVKFNGDYTLDHICTSSKITENSTEFYIEASFLINRLENEAVYNLMCENSVLKVNDEYGDEYFRICNVNKRGKYIDVYARQISIQDSLTMYLEDVRPTNCNGVTAINAIYNGATTRNIFTVYSDITKINTAYYIHKSVYEAIYKDDNCFLKRWGGEIQRRAFTVRINEIIGSDKGVSIRSRKNLIGLEASSNIDSLMTRIYPKGFDGITIPEKYINSPKINNYEFIYSKEIKFEDIRVNDENYTEGFATLEAAQEELRKRVNLMYSEDKVDEIKASYRVDFVELGKTEEYKNYSILESTAVGDTVRVYDEELKIDIQARISERKYDNLNKRRLETDLSNFKSKSLSIGDIIGDLENKTDSNSEDIKNTLKEAKEFATALLEAGIKNSYVVVKKNEILIMDSPDVNTSVNVWRWNKNGLGFSRSGYFGLYETAITSDGKIVADFIKTGILDAEIVRVGFNGINSSFEITASEVIQRTSTGAKSVVFSNGETKYYNTSTGENVGRIGSSVYDNFNNAVGVGIYTKEGSFVGLGCRNDATNRLESYLNVYNGPRLPYLNPGINIYEAIHINYEDMWNPTIHFNSDDLCGIWGTTSGDSVAIAGNKELLLCNKNINGNDLVVRMCLRDSEIYVQNNMWFAGNNGPYYSIQNAIIQGCQIKANTVAAENAVSPFSLQDKDTERYISKGITDTVEQVGTVNVVNGVATVELPVDVMYSNYYVFLSSVGRVQPYIIAENDNSFIIGCDEDKIVKYLIKFEIPQIMTLPVVENKELIEPEIPTRFKSVKESFTSFYEE